MLDRKFGCDWGSCAGRRQARSAAAGENRPVLPGEALRQAETVSYVEIPDHALVLSTMRAPGKRNDAKRDAAAVEIVCLQCYVTRQ
jgi:hypothetical protein